MAKLHIPFLSFSAKGKLGDITLRRRRNTSIAEDIPSPKDTKSTAQLSWRHMYQKAVALWHALSASEKLEWESLATPKHMTGFAYFISTALKPNPGLYLPLQGGVMQGAVDMDGHAITDLPDPSANQDAVTKAWYLANLPAGGYTQGARVYHNADQSISTGTWTTLAFNSERWDTDGIHDNVTNNSRLTCRTAGNYIISAQIVWEPNISGYRQVNVYLNGGISWVAILDSPAYNNTFTQIAVTILNLAVGDYVDVRVLQNSGVAVKVQFVNGRGPDFMMQRVG